jgi:hypothetical protein
MATGDLAASKGLKVFAATQDRRLGYDNDNQRGDDVAAVMIRADKLESSAKNPTVVQEAAVNGGSIGIGGGTLGATGTLALTALPYKRVIEIDCGALVTGLGDAQAKPDRTDSPWCDIILRRTIGSTQTELRSWRAPVQQMSVGGHFSDVLPANTAVVYQLLFRSSRASAVTSNGSFTYLTLTIPTNVI